MKTILLTGSGGFVGSWLRRDLEGRFALLTPRSHELDLLDELSVERFFKNHNIDAIIHSAAYGALADPNATLATVAEPNIKMFKNLARFASPRLAMINLGSGAEYDKRRPLIKVKEDAFGELIPEDAYGYSKYIISKEIEKRDDIVNLRIFGVYGPGESAKRVTTSILNDHIRLEPITLNQNVLFDFIYVDDLCKIVRFFLENRTKEKCINTTPTRSVEIIELARIANTLADYQVEIVVKKAGLGNAYTADNSRLLNAIGDFEFTSYREGLRLLRSTLAL